MASRTTLITGSLLLLMAVVAFVVWRDDAVVEGGTEPVPIAEPQAGQYFEFPPDMEEYRASVESSAMDYATASATAASTQHWESKLLGTPYLPAGTSYPLDIYGQPLQLLAQINFAELPRLAEFPQSGMLQFFISPIESDEQIWGMRFYEERVFDAQNYLDILQRQDYFRVVFYPDVDRDAPQEPAPQVEIGYLPVNQEARLEFRIETGVVTTADYRFEQLFDVDAYEFFDQFDQQGDLVWEEYDRYAGQYSIARVGGYASFAQEDPRILAPDEDWLLLLQLDSFRTADGVEVLWGDVGVGSFHIRREDLLNWDFSRVLYSWDSH